MKRRSWFAPSAHCLAAKIAEAADLQRYRSISVCQPLSSRAASAKGFDDCAARDGHPLASGGLPELLALEVTAARRAPTDPARDPPNHSGNEFGQSPVGCAADPWGTPQAGDRCWADECRQIYGQGQGAAAVTGLRTFITNHADGIAAIDLFVVPTISFRLLYGLLILRHERARCWS